MPAAGGGPLSEKAYEFQTWVVRGAGVPLVLSMLTSPSFLAGADIHTRKHAFLAVLRLAKFLLSVVGHSILYMVVEAQQPNSSNKVSCKLRKHFFREKYQSLQNIGNISDNGNTLVKIKPDNFFFN